MTSIAILEAVNTSYVPFNGQQIITAMAAGVAYVAMKPIVENLGMSWGTQQQKLMKSLAKFNCIHMNMVAADGKLRKLLCLPLKKLNGWLFSINPEKVRADIRDKLIQYQEECFTVLHDYWTKGEVKNPRKSDDKTSTDDRTPLRGLVNRIMGKTGIHYQPLYKMIHREFGVKHIDELTSKQVAEAMEYLAGKVLEGELMPRENIPVPIAKQFTDDELQSLCWLWNNSVRMVSHIADVEPLLRVAEHRLAPAYYSMPREYSQNMNAVRRLLERETMHIHADRHTIDDWRVLNQLRIPELH